MARTLQPSVSATLFVSLAIKVGDGVVKKGNLNSILFLLTMPPVLWTTGSLIDNHLLKGKSSPETLVAISGIFNLALALVLGSMVFVKGGNIEARWATPVMLNGATHALAMWLYLHALKSEEPTRVIPWFQTVPAFGIVIGYLLLKEIPTATQIVGIALLMVGGFILAVKQGVVRHKLMALMLLSSAALAVNDVVLARFGRNVESTDVMFVHVFGKSVWCFLFLLAPACRAGFASDLKQKMGWQSTSETCAILADFLFDRGKVLVVPVALVQATACSAPLFALLTIALIHRFYPKAVAGEETGALWQKVSGTLLIVAGGTAVTVFG